MHVSDELVLTRLPRTVLTILCSFHIFCCYLDKLAKYKKPEKYWSCCAQNPAITNAYFVYLYLNSPQNIISVKVKKALVYLIKMFRHKQKAIKVKSHYKVKNKTVFCDFVSKVNTVKPTKQ